MMAGTEAETCSCWDKLCSNTCQQYKYKLCLTAFYWHLWAFQHNGVISAESDMRGVHPVGRPSGYL